jgi:hypothetical protein
MVLFSTLIRSLIKKIISLSEILHLKVVILNLLSILYLHRNNPRYSKQIF